MDIKLLENIAGIREMFINNFVMSWDKFQIERKEVIDEILNRCFKYFFPLFTN